MSVNSKNQHCGVDFGTTNSTLAVSQNLHPTAVTIDKSSSNPTVLKSLLYLDPNQNYAVGSEAIKRYLFDLETIPSKAPRLVDTGRLIKTFGPSTGSGVGPPIWVPEIIELDDSGRGRLLQSLKSVLTNSSFTGTNIFGQFYSLEQLLTLIMTQIKTNAELSLDHPLESVVIGRPVRYVGQGESQTAINRMTQIATNAGFKNIEFEFEPIGAALNYGIDISTNQNILVFDFGGGTLDVCVMKLPEKQLLAVSGRPIGGDLLNARLVQSKLMYQFGSKAIVNHKLPIPHHYFHSLVSWYQTTTLKTVKNIEILKELAVRSNQPDYVNNFVNLIVNDYGFDFFNKVDLTKIMLSTVDGINFEFNRPHLNLVEPLTRLDFESAIRNEIDESRLCLHEALSAAGLKPSQINQVILTGGSSQVPIFIDLIKSIFPPQNIIASDYFTSVALGLSLRAEQIFA
jgi:hypothetical chaperone protein